MNQQLTLRSSTSFSTKYAQNGNSCFVARSELCRLAAPYAPLADQETELHKAKYLQASEFDLER
ncbi:MAG: hypothetical protein ACJA1J_000828 [Sulfitobacter pontiacus]